MDKWSTIISDGIMVAQGWKCAKCGLIRPADRAKCNCKEKKA